MADAFLIRRSDGSYRVVSVPTGPAAPRLLRALREALDLACDHRVARVEVEECADYIAECNDEREQTRAWARQHEAEALRDHCRRVVARWRERTTGRGI